MHRRRFTGLLGAITGQVLLAGCTKLPWSAGDAVPTAAELLLAAARKLAEATVIVNVKAPGWSSVSKLDPPGRMGSIVFETTKDGKQFKLNVTLIDGDLWIMEIVDGRLLEKVKYLSNARAAAAGVPDIMPSDDPTGAVAMVKAMSEVRRGGDFQGLIDLTKAASGGSRYRMNDLADVKALQASATVDPEGRLSSVKVDLEQVGSGRFEVEYAAFGRGINKLQRPSADQVMDAPDELVQRLAKELF